jgi:Na+-translocating ferredoxin:NAD+ oxidoreductase RnfA subunit
MIFVLLLAGIVVLQIFLSKRVNRWLGLLLPAVSVIFALLGAANVVVDPAVTPFQNALSVFSVFLLYSIPSLILLAIYAACREKIKKKKDIDRMNIQDLE